MAARRPEWEPRLAVCPQGGEAGDELRDTCGAPVVPGHFCLLGSRQGPNEHGSLMLAFDDERRLKP